METLPMPPQIQEFRLFLAVNIYSFLNRNRKLYKSIMISIIMGMQSISMFRDARIIDTAKEGNTMSGIAQQTGIPFPTVRRAVYAFENIGVMRSTKIGKKVFVRINRSHPIIDSMITTARWVNTVMWDPNSFVADICAKNKIDYAFVGTSKIRYTKNESRNMVQIAISKKDYVRAKKIIYERFKGIGIKITEDPRETIGNAMSMIYVKCFPVDSIKFKEHQRKTSINEIIKVRVADEKTERQAIRQSTKKDRIFVPMSVYK